MPVTFAPVPTELADIGHNGDAGAELRSFIERAENLAEEAKQTNEAKKDLFAEARSRGFDPKIIKAVLKIRAEDPQAREEREALIATYLTVLGDR